MPAHPINGNPLVIGLNQAIKIDSSIFRKRIDMCKYSIIGRIILLKGETPWPLPALKEFLASIWGLHSQWRFISLGKGYFHILLTSVEDNATNWSQGPLNLKLVILRLNYWKSLGGENS